MNAMITYPVTISNLGLTVANIKSAVKRVQVAERNRLRNKAYKSAVKTFTKRYTAAVETYAAAPTVESEQAARAELSTTYSKIDKAVKRGALHPNAAARRKARLADLYKRRVETQAVKAQAVESKEVESQKVESSEVELQGIETASAEQAAS